jgi:hypothetical protein
MLTKTIFAGPVVISLLMADSLLMAADEYRVLFDFGDPHAVQKWQTVNDGVMGGVSEGQFKISRETMEFFGTLSLENNGGFASVRSRPTRLGLENGDTLIARVRGDGREYTLNLYVPRPRTAFSYRWAFKPQKNEWVEIRAPLDKFVATSFGRVVPDEPLNAAEVNAIGFLLSDKQAGPFKLEVEWIRVMPPSKAAYGNVSCEGVYPHHLQGICVDDAAIYWCFTTQLVKTDLQGKLLGKVPVANHHGDLCFHDGKLYVAVNLGRFNDPAGNADSWVYVYDAQDLSLITQHETREVFHGAGGIGFRNGHFFVVGGLPAGIEENYVYEYDDNFTFVKKHIVQSGYTRLGVQTATFADDRWWFGCYGEALLVTDAEFRMMGRYGFDCSLGIVGLSDGRFLAANGRCEPNKGCVGSVRLVVPDDKVGLVPFR